jgi:acyl-CoA synthetase (NDP forming)
VARSSKLWSLNPRYVVTIGNQMDLTVGDYLRGLAAEEDLRVFACYVEGFREGDGERWVETAASLAAAGKAVVLYRAGRTPAGARATASHTASIAGDYAVTRALATAAGALVAETHEDFEDLVRLACRLDGRPVPGFALGMLSNAGFECVTAADNLGPFVLAPFAPATVRRLEGLLAAARLEAIVGVQNPLDVTPILGDEAFEAAARAIVGDPGVDVGVVGCVPLSGALATVAAAEGHGEDLGRSGAIGPRLAGLFAASGKPWVAVVDAGPLYDPFAHLLEARGVPVFRTADRALRLLGTWAAWRHARGAGSARP